MNTELSKSGLLFLFTLKITEPSFCPLFSLLDQQPQVIALLGKALCIRMFEPSKEAAFFALEDFLPRAGRDYAASRNTDSGPGYRKNVSQLSPWVRTRLLPEWTIIKHVLEHHSPSLAGKFIDEVCWRTYWKGWLQLRPKVWDDCLKELEMQFDEWAENEIYASAIAGQSGIECMDAWTCELIETGYLHNHSRMWYASIWIHTLKLPWTLGAAFFLTHLLDGDPASNTLSWRWVAGLHTPGKTYLARPENIRRYTNNRFAVDEPLAKTAFVPETPPLPDRRLLPELQTPPPKARLGLLVQEDDLSALTWIPEQFDIQAVAGLFPRNVYQAHKIADTVADFRHTCMTNVLLQDTPCFDSVDEIANWAEIEVLDAVIMAEIPVGLWNTPLRALKVALTKRKIDICFIRHWWDATLHPRANAGFFSFKKAIPEVLSKLA